MLISFIFFMLTKLCVIFCDFSRSELWWEVRNAKILSAANNTSVWLFASAQMLTAEGTCNANAGGGASWYEGGVRVYNMCVFIHNTPRFHSQTNPTRAPATLVCAGSFISSPITGPLLPLWMGFKSLRITTVTS